MQIESDRNLSRLGLVKRQILGQRSAADLSDWFFGQNVRQSNLGSSQKFWEKTNFKVSNSVLLRWLKIASFSSGEELQKNNSEFYDFFNAFATDEKNILSAAKKAELGNFCLRNDLIPSRVNVLRTLICWKWILYTR